MQKLILFALLGILGVKFGFNYLVSEEFQKFGDAKKAQWTCRVNNVLGNLFIVASKYERAYDLFARVIERCPETPMVEEATFKMGECLEDMGRPNEAIPIYAKYAETYPNTRRARLAVRRSQNIQLSR